MRYEVLVEGRCSQPEDFKTASDRARIAAREGRGVELWSVEEENKPATCIAIWNGGAGNFG